MKKSSIVYLLSIAFSFLLMSHACDKKSKKEDNNTVTTENTTDMNEKIKFSFSGDYKDMWLKVDSLEREGLYKSALELVSVIFETSKKEENVPQELKCIIHKVKYKNYIEEDDYIKAIEELSLLSASEKFPLKQLIHSVTAEIYWMYYEQNRWEFNDRSQTVDFENKDIRTWDLKRLTDAVNKEYLLSLTEADKSRRTDIMDFKEILLDTEDAEKIQPTLYDFLASRAIGYFQNSESGLTRPADKFVIEGKKYFDQPTAFAAMDFNSTDSMSNDLYAIQIYREVTKAHLDDADPAPLVDVNLKRLFYVKSKCKDEQKNEWYLEALNQLIEKYSGNEVFSELIYHKALYYNGLGDLYSKENPDDRWQIKKAFELCSEGISKYPNSYGANLCTSLQQSIQEKSISFLTESAYIPERKGKFLVNYKNVDSLYFKVIEVNNDFFENNRYYDENMVSELLKKPVAKEWSSKLQNPGDYQLHNTEIVLPALKFGMYVILASPKNNFSIDRNAVAYANFAVTNLAYTQRPNDNGTTNVMVTHRETGKPLKGVKATVIVKEYNYTSGKYETKRMESYVTSEKGMFVVANKKSNRSFFLELKDGNDTYNSGNQLYQYRNDYKPEAATYTHFYTDRAIYRPGQTVYFKGIKIRSHENAHTIVKGQNSKVTFHDANYQKIAELDVTTNEYGTFSGSFTAPTSGLNGSMTIQDQYGSKQILVEEYKRPKFEVSFEPVKGSYKLNQTIKVTGLAKAYAGSNIDGAKVQYRITRSSSFPRWIYYRWGYYPPAQSNVEITNGETITDEKGNFTVQFDAKSDPSVNAKYFPNFTYTIIADVTDINGETRSSQQTVVVGAASLDLSLEMKEKIEKSEDHKFSIRTNNLNGQKIATKGSISVTKLIEPTHVYRTSLWQNPDMKDLSESEYRSLFPNDEYDNEGDVTKLQKGQKVFSKNFDTKETNEIILSEFKTISTGRYLVEIEAKDSFGVDVKDQKYITVFDKTSLKPASQEIWSVTTLNTVCEPGTNASFLISSAAQDMNVLFEIEKQGKIVKSEIIQLNEAQKLISIPITEEDRGNVHVHFSAVKFGRNYSESHLITVPYSNKELALTFETFRDKLLPGAKEEWKLRIRGPKGEKLAAELLVSMYDASLDAFASNDFYLSPYTYFYSRGGRNSYCFSANSSQLIGVEWNQYSSFEYRNYLSLNWFGFNNSYPGGRYYTMMEDSSVDGFARTESSSNLEEVTTVSRGKAKESKNDRAGAPPSPIQAQTGSNLDEYNGASDKLEAGGSKDGDGKAENRPDLTNVQARSNLNETAFFYPQLETDPNGDVLIKFTMPEALTKWKLIGLAHTKDLKIGNIQKEVVTQKELMVQPNAPRFMREGDQMVFSSKVSNLSTEDLTGTAQLFLFDAATMQPIDHLFKNTNSSVSFQVKKDQSAPLMWNIEIPEGIGAVKYRVVAQAKNHTDGEEMVVPILSNRMLVTESLPLPSKGIGTKNFDFTKLLASGSSSSIRHHQVTLEYTSNPAWYAIQAMPYMMEYPHECAEQLFTRYYSNAIASNIVNSSPKIKQVFESWKQSSPDAFLSNLQKNQELKSVMLEETPWVLEAKDESQRKRNVALLFDLNKMDNDLDKAITKLEKLQVSNGGWTWFPGMPESRYITQHIITGMGHLDHLNVKNVREERRVWKMTEDGVKYLDKKLVEDLDWLKAHAANYKTDQHISEIHIQYLYARSYFKDIPMNDKVKEAFDYYQAQAAKYWTSFGIYNQGMIALQAHRYDNLKLGTGIMKSIKERALLNEELGMYWKDNIAGYYWYQAPIETQALLIEAFDEVANDQQAVEEMKVWLLKQKQTTDWKTTKATTEACYALLLRGVDILENTEQVEIKINGKLLDPKALGASVEAGTGYFKTSWNGKDVTPDLGKISVTRKTNGVSWGAMYWQYFEDLDKITTHDTQLNLDKQLFIVKNTASGPVISPISANTKLKVGDKVRVRIELRTDRNMEYVHMKDMRAAGFEPINVLSSYKWQGGLGYYESTRDAATHFFFDYLPKGTHVFEYDIRVSHVGQFSNGVATIQCMYAPEFTSHSEGIKVIVE